VNRAKGAEVKPDKPEDGFAGDTVVPVIQEVPAVGKRTVETGRLRIDKTVSEREILLDEPLLREDVLVERIPIGRDVGAGEELPGIRYDGETMIVPVLEEVPVVVKKIVLAAEIRVTRVKRVFHDPQTISVKVEEVSVEREDEGSSTDSSRR
jgi:uncharacterized protein (TIGR02271 family)